MEQPLPNGYDPFAYGGDPYGDHSGYEPSPETPQKPIGFAIAALVLGLLSLLGMCCCTHIVTAPLAVIFGIIALVKHHRGTGMSITGIITAALSLLITVMVLSMFSGFWQYSDVLLEDFMRLCAEQDEVFPAYEQTGTLPDYMLKYTEDPYAEIFEDLDMTIYDVMDALLISYKNGELPSVEDAVGSGQVSALWIDGSRLLFE